MHLCYLWKNDGNVRKSIDYCHWNKVTIHNKFLIPRIDDLFDNLYGIALFSKYIVRLVYHQLKIREEDIPKIIFESIMGTKFLIMLFGLTNALFPSSYFYEYNEWGF